MAITYVGSGAEATGFTGASAAVPYPAGIAAGDFLWVPASAGVSTAFATNAMSAAGFTRRYALNSGGSSPVGAGFYKIATGSETGTATLNSPGGTVVGRMFAYRGVDPTTPFDVADATFGSSTVVTAYDLPAQVTTIVGCTLVTHAWSNNVTGTWTPPTSYTELMDSTAGGTMNATQVAHRLAWASSGDTGVRSIVRSAASRGGAAGVVLRPADTAVAATSAVALPRLTSSAVAVVMAAGAAASSLPKLATSASAAVMQSGASAATLPRLQAAAVAAVANRGPVASVMPALHSSAVASVRVAATVNATLPLLQTAAELTIPTVGVVDITLPALRSSAFADVYLDKSHWRNITITVGTPSGHTLTVGPAIGHPMHAGPPRSEP